MDIFKSTSNMKKDLNQTSSSMKANRKLVKNAKYYIVYFKANKISK